MKHHEEANRETYTSNLGEAPALSKVQMVFPPGQIYREMRQVVLLIAGLYLIYRLAGPISAILLFFLMVFMLAAALNPIVLKLNEWGVPRMVAASGIVFVGVAAIALLGWLAVPPLIQELTTFVQQFDTRQLTLAQHYDNFRDRLPLALGEQLPSPSQVLESFRPNLSTLVGRLGAYAMNAVAALVSLILFFVLLVYTLGNPEPLVAGFLAAVPEKHRSRADTTLRRIMEKLKWWVISAVLVGLIVGTATGVGLYFLDVPSPLVFALLAAFGEQLPYLGPILSAVPPILLALTIDPMLAVWVALLFLVIQQLESNILSPLIFGENLKLHPVSLLFTIMVMHSQFGLLGAFLAIPVCSIIKVCWEEWYLEPRGTDGEAVKEEADALIADPAVEDEGPLDEAENENSADGTSTA